MAREQRDPLVHEDRVEIMELLEETEATTLEVAKQIGDGTLDLPTVAYHLAVLEHGGLIERVGGLWRRT